MKKILAVLLCVALLAGFSTVAFSASAKTAKVDGAKWFPCEPGRENDILWEVEANKDGCLCQAFDADPNETGMTSFLSTQYGEDGSLTIARTGADGEDFYWPRIRTLQLEDYPMMDWTVANTLYFDFEASANWNLMIGINGIDMKLAKYIHAATGAAAKASTQDDGDAGKFQGSINIQDVIADIVANETADAESKNGAIAFQNMGANTFVPQVTFFCIGDKTASMKINKLYISTPEDTEGDNCTYMYMGVIYGDEYYEEIVPDDQPEEESKDDSVTTTTTSTTTTQAVNNDVPKQDGPKGDSPKTADTSVAVAALMVASFAALMTVSASKTRKNSH